MKEIPLTVLLLAIPVCFWGYVYEVSYFKTLNEDTPKELGLLHYILSGFFPLASLFAILLIFATARAFFLNIDTSDYVKNDLNLSTLMANAKLRALDEFRFAKYVALVCFAFPFITYYWEEWIDHKWNPGLVYLYLIWIAFGAFLLPLIASALHQKVQIFLLMSASIAAIFSGAGIYAAKNDLTKADAVIRDDALVKIERLQTGYSSSVKSLEGWSIFEYLK